VEKGTLVEFWHHGERRLAIVDRPEGKKHIIVIDASERSHTLHPRDVTYSVKGSFKLKEIGSFWQEAEALIDPESLAVAWEMLVEDGGVINPKGMAELLFSDTEETSLYAAHCLLFDDKLYFKNKKEDSYEPRSRSQVEEIKHQQTVKEQKDREKQEFLERVRAKKAGEDTVTWTDGDRLKLETLEKYVLDPEQPPRGLTELLNILNCTQNPANVTTLLVELKWWNVHENLSLKRAQIPVQFHSLIVSATQAALDNPPEDPDGDRRRNLTHLRTYTIDDESTQEIDDGLSWEILPDGREKIWVHIADPSRWIFPDDPLDIEARRRSTTVYLPTGAIPMFPMELAAGPMSLVQGVICYALSFGVVLEADGGISEYEITTSTVKPTYRLTYEDVDCALEEGMPEEPALEALDRLAKLRAHWRQSQGSIVISMPEAIIKVKPEADDISIAILEDSRARELVAEMMILTGEVAAHYGKTHQLPLPYRSQPQPELPSDSELWQLPAGPVRYAAMRRCMPRSETSTIPSRHAGLGLEHYTQVTSPIRRYTDLLAHFQIKAHLRGSEPPYNGERLLELVQTASSNAYESTLVERQTNRYWTLEYLRRQGDRHWQSIVLRWLREDDDLAAILLEDIGVELAMRIQRSVNLGETIFVRVTHIDPRQDIIHLREVTPAAATTPLSDLAVEAAI
jgi:exoribonuclease-2